jgi:hypothetical protein
MRFAEPPSSIERSDAVGRLQLTPELQVSIVSPTDDVRATRCLLGVGDVVAQGVADVVTSEHVRV